MNDDDRAFLAEMADVAPLKQDAVDLKPQAKDQQDFVERRYHAENHFSDNNPLSDSTVKEVAPHDIVSFKCSGIQNGVFKSLRLGKYGYDAKIDLHNHTVAEARLALYDFIQECIRYDLRTVMILHGKGGRTGDNIATIKSHAVHWLQCMPQIMAFHSAPSNQGGAGALYVLLAKSEKARQNNRELHGGR